MRRTIAQWLLSAFMLAATKARADGWTLEEFTTVLMQISQRGTGWQSLASASPTTPGRQDVRIIESLLTFLVKRFGLEAR